MKRFLVGLMLISFLMSAEIGRYKVQVTTYTSPKTGKLYIVETTFDTTTGKVIDRKRFYHTKYKKFKRNRDD